MQPGDDIVAVDRKPEPRGVGEMLRARRLELGLSQADVASVVKLPARRVDAMERERWDELPDGPYLRGFLRNIARALSIDASALVERVDASLMQARNPDSILIPQVATHIALPRRSGPADDRRGGRTLFFGAFAFAIIAALIAWSGTDSFERLVATARTMVGPAVGAGPSTSSQPTSSQPAPSQAAPSLPSPGIAEPAPVSVAESSKAVVLTTPEGMSTAKTETLATVPSASSPAAGERALRFHFNDQSWVEVRAGDGKVLLQRLNAAGSEQQVEGEPPFALIVGNAKNVVLVFRGLPVDLAPYTRDQVARFTLS